MKGGDLCPGDMLYGDLVVLIVEVERHPPVDLGCTAVRVVTREGTLRWHGYGNDERLAVSVVRWNAPHPGASGPM